MRYLQNYTMTVSQFILLLSAVLIKESGAQVAYLHVDSGAAIGRAGRALPAFDSLVE